MFGKPSLVSQVVRSMRREPARWRIDGQKWVRDDGVEVFTHVLHISAMGVISLGDDKFSLSSDEAWKIISAECSITRRENFAAGERIKRNLAKSQIEGE